MKIMSKFKKLIKHIENPEIPISYYIIFFFFVVTIRNFWEMFIYDSPVLFAFQWHYTIFYITLALALIIILHYAVGSKIKKILRVVLSGFIFIFLAPIFDYIIARPDYYIEKYYIGYLEPGFADSIWQRLFTFFGPYADRAAVTPGIHIEIFIILLAIFIYIFIKKKSWLRSLIFTLITYVVIFAYFSIPYFVKGLLGFFDLAYEYSNALMINFLLLILPVLALIVFYLYSKKYFVAIFKDIRIFRLIHFELMFFVGSLLALVYLPGNTVLELDQGSLFHWVFLVIAIACAWIFSVMTNNIADYNLDKINSPERPLTSSKIDIKHYRIIAAVFFILALVYSWSVYFVFFMMIFVFMGFYFLYSMPPLRLKTIPILSKFLIATNSLVLIILGFLFVSGSMTIPPKIVIFVLLGFTAVINFIDIKDYHGDKVMGIKTLPTILGLKKSKILIAIFMLLAYFASFFILESTYLSILFTFIGFLQAYFIISSDYKEKPVFITYIASIVVFIIYTYLNL